MRLQDGGEHRDQLVDPQRALRRVLGEAAGDQIVERLRIDCFAALEVRGAGSSSTCRASSSSFGASNTRFAVSS